MQLSFTEKKNIRKSFGKLKESLSIPNLIEVQKNSYKELTEFYSEAELLKVLIEFLKVYFQLKI
jgi:DNA-directed RNA polymerase subunit beta